MTMPRWTRWLGAILAAAVLLAGAAVFLAARWFDRERVTGLVADEVRQATGRELHFDTTQTRFDAAGFPPQHLQEHRALAQPVTVTYQARDGVNRVVKLEDAAP